MMLTRTIGLAARAATLPSTDNHPAPRPATAAKAYATSGH
jgi:hypothetical protein